MNIWVDLKWLKSQMSKAYVRDQNTNVDRSQAGNINE